MMMMMMMVSSWLRIWGSAGPQIQKAPSEEKGLNNTREQPGAAALLVGTRLSHSTLAAQNQKDRA